MWFAIGSVEDFLTLRFLITDPFEARLRGLAVR